MAFSRSEAFTAFDSDSDGQISYATAAAPGSSGTAGQELSELERAMSLLDSQDHSWSKQQMDAVLESDAAASDSDQDGRLNREEFAQMALSLSSHPCMVKYYIDKEAVGSALLHSSLVAGVLLSAAIFIGGWNAMPSNAMQVRQRAF